MTLIEPRKKPGQARSLATVDAILEAAARILDREGLDGLNTNAVARLAGVSIGSLYQYFPNKNAILAELLRHKRHRLLDDMRVALAGSGALTLNDGIASLVRAALRNQARTPRLARALDYANATLPLDRETEETNRAIIETIAGFLTRHRHPHAVEAARDIVALTRGMMEQMSRAGKLDDQASVDRICLAIRGYLGELRQLDASVSL